MKIHKKIRIGIYIFCYNFQSIGNLKLNFGIIMKEKKIGIFQSIGNLKLKFWDYNEEKMGFHITHTKKVLLPVKPWGMRMQWEHPV